MEAVIFLPTLVILLLGARFIARRYEGELHALGEARTCAVRFADDGCRKVPAGCAASLISRSPGTNADGAPATLSRSLERAAGTVKRLSSVPAFGDARDALLLHTARSERAVVVEGFDRSAKTAAVARGTVAFPCNELSHADDVAKQVFESVTSPFLSPP